MGLGPHGTSLLKRLGNPTEPPELLAIELDQLARTEARKLARIAYGKKHKAKVKPLAPVEETDLKGYQDQQRLWKWLGEEIVSKGLTYGGLYNSKYLRSAGFKLPRLKKKEKIRGQG